jgi:hypothetical protein
LEKIISKKDSFTKPTIIHTTSEPAMQSPRSGSDTGKYDQMSSPSLKEKEEKNRSPFKQS